LFKDRENGYSSKNCTVQIFLMENEYLTSKTTQTITLTHHTHTNIFQQRTFIFHFSSTGFFGGGVGKAFVMPEPLLVVSTSGIVPDDPPATRRDDRGIFFLTNKVKQTLLVSSSILHFLCCGIVRVAGQGATMRRSNGHLQLLGRNRRRHAEMALMTAFGLAA
jgi:hypothetical protein